METARNHEQQLLQFGQGVSGDGGCGGRTRRDSRSEKDCGQSHTLDHGPRLGLGGACSTGGWRSARSGSLETRERTERRRPTHFPAEVLVPYTGEGSDCPVQGTSQHAAVGQSRRIAIAAFGSIRSRRSHGVCDRGSGPSSDGLPNAKQGGAGLDYPGTRPPPRRAGRLCAHLCRRR